MHSVLAKIDEDAICPDRSRGASMGSSVTGTIPLPSLPLDSATSCSIQLANALTGGIRDDRQLVAAGQGGFAQNGAQGQAGTPRRGHRRAPHCRCIHTARSNRRPMSIPSSAAGTRPKSVKCRVATANRRIGKEDLPKTQFPCQVLKGGVCDPWSRRIGASSPWLRAQKKSNAAVHLCGPAGFAGHDVQALIRRIFRGGLRNLSRMGRIKNAKANDIAVVHRLRIALQRRRSVNSELRTSAVRDEPPIPSTRNRPICDSPNVLGKVRSRP